MRTSLGQSNMKPGDFFIVSNTFFRSIALKKPEKIIDVISDIKATLHSGQSQLELLVKETYKEFTEEKLTWKDLQTHEEKINEQVKEMVEKQDKMEKEVKLKLAEISDLLTKLLQK